MSNIYHTEPPTAGKVLIHTSFGDIDIELWSKECPLACRNFIQLALEGYFDGTLINRVQKGFMVQFGDPSNTGSGGESIWGRPFKDEIHGRIKFNHRGQVAMANSNKPNSNQSQFFVTLDNCDWLQGKHTIFGKVTGNTIYNVLRMGETEVSENDHPVNDIRVLNVEVLWNPFEDIIPRVIEKVDRVEQSSQPKKPQGNAKAVKNSKLLSFGDDDDDDDDDDDEQGDEDLQSKKVVMKSVHETKAPGKQAAKVMAMQVDDETNIPGSRVNGDESKLTRKRKLDERGDQSNNDDDDGEDYDYHRRALQQPRPATSSHQRLSEEDEDEGDALLDEDAIKQAMKMSKRDSHTKEKSQEFLQVRDALLRSRRAVHVMTGAEAAAVEKQVAFHEMVTPLEQRRLKYMKRKADHGDRADETLRKLEAFKMALSSSKQANKAGNRQKESAQAEAYHGQVLEKYSDAEEEGEDGGEEKREGGRGNKEKDWFAGKLKFKKHIDDQYRNGFDSSKMRKDDDYEVVDTRRESH